MDRLLFEASPKTLLMWRQGAEKRGGENALRFVEIVIKRLHRKPITNDEASFAEQYILSR